MNPELESLEFGTVLGLVSSYARTAVGRGLLSEANPWDSRAGLRRLHQLEMDAAWRLEPGRFPVQPMDEALDQVLHPAGWLEPAHWRQLRDGLRAFATLRASLAGLDWPADRPAPEGVHLGIDRLRVTAELLPDPSPLADKLAKAFDADGNLDPLRVPGLADLHRERAGAFQAVQQKLQKNLRTTPDAFFELAIVERNGRYCLPVRSDRRSLVGGLVLDRSSSGATVFMEPMDAVPFNNAFVEADAAYREAVQAFLRTLLAELRNRVSDFSRWRELQGAADAALACLRWASVCGGALPDHSERLCLLEAKHPLLLPAVREGLGLEALPHAIVPLNLVMEAGRPGLIVSGSNTGGKTVVLKTVGLLWALAASGFAVPAAMGSAFPALPSLHADIGDHQTLVGSLSTFSSHVVHLKAILKGAAPGGLVLLDELGTGTDPKEGAALGIAILHALARRDCWVLCSTHLGDISRWALRHQKFQNASVQFDEEKLAPTYRLLVGQPGQSRALAIAARLGLDKPVLDKAEMVLGERERDWREFLQELEAERLRLIEESERLETMLRRAAHDKDILDQRETRLREDQERFARDAQDRVQRVLDFLDHEGKRLVKDLKHQAKVPAANPDRMGSEANERVKTLQQVAAAELGPLSKTLRPSSKPAELQVDDHARHKGLGVEGRVVERKGDRVVLLTSSGRRLESRLGELTLIGAKEIEKPRGRVRVKVEAEDIQDELNLIGRASDEVDSEIYRFVERCVGGGARFARIVHGHGTGKLKMAVRGALKGHPGIAGIEDAPQAQGGAGATLITFR
ncbi:MAG TPA: Smr/MutS family protein [Holophagaceae bacterium]|jgi:DNA mismatch repair protein MutS2|nr:Smr/MutS family protein [Holophagaceae bacterium]